MSKRDFYDVLGVKKDSSQDEIKKAYRTMARKYHPDVNPGDQEAETKFKEAKEAYETLSDSQKRQFYDQFGHQDPSQGQGGFGGQGFGGQGFGGFEDIFESFFGGGFNQTARRGPQRGADLRYDISISFEEAAFGVEKEVTLQKMGTCKKCEGTGAKTQSSVKTCPTCKGAGQVQYAQNTPFGRIVNSRTCTQCNGEGSIIKDPCPVCHGRGKKQVNKTINIKVPAGIDNGSRLRVQNEGEPGDKGGPPGDLYVFINVQPHEVFTRHGNEILIEEEISYVQAALGVSIEVPTLDGKAKLKIPAGTQSGTMFKLRGKGIPYLRGVGRGDQHVKVNVEIPKTLGEEEKELLKKLAEIRGESVESAPKGLFNRVKDALNKNS
ncbi:molecular chaperone DnaJ [Alkalicella caledoniensis]|uniref:Chaperone protein DnaJ n=1 Tax=Alkalicella caledoniensis TaxID=2731377 RepID=A0A7G9W4F7_ALKCA|nr:molecular chaperone DnaJ [Alkalicella caledoniensis]QNO13569.1 molecular chaperone DnaJ [Alkalicella caledoniensis]